MEIDVPAILMDLGFSNATIAVGPPTLKRCELWTAQDNSIRGTNTKIRFLILHSGFLEGNADATKQQLSTLGGGQLHHVLFEDNAPSQSRQSKVQATFPGARVSTIGACLREEMFRGQVIAEPQPTELYVAPTVVPASGPQPTEPATVTLLKWMFGAGFTPSRVGILLGPAGTGKTALAMELFKEFMRNCRSDVRALPFPLFIDRFAWINHDFRDTTDNLAALLGHAISTQFEFQPPIARIQRCLRYGALCAILDGFDELCATKPSQFGADDTIAALINTLEGVDGSRVLLTCRESFWHDNVDVNLQSKITAFRLSPFSEAQRREYLNKRFPNQSDKQKRDRTSNLLNRIAEFRTPIMNQSTERSNLSFLPWVVQFSAEAADFAGAGDYPTPMLSIPGADPACQLAVQVRATSPFDADGEVGRCPGYIIEGRYHAFPLSPAMARMPLLRRMSRRNLSPDCTCAIRDSSPA